MPVFSKTLPTLERHMGFDLKRTPESKPIDGIVTCELFLVTQTHFWGGRTVPHELYDCPACARAQPFRTHVYISAIMPDTREHFLFECSSNAAKAFEEYLGTYGTLRGCFFRASRPKKTKNGKVVILTKQADLTKCHLPQPPDIERALCVIWQVPYDGTSPNQTILKKDGANIDPEIKREMSTPRDNAGEPVLLSSVVDRCVTNKVRA